ncbi:uncharacterized protein LOC129572357 [Sitodiplosis mosellana]|uniref:uncharacterized protein LOC129572357 n=1 Tax=Sitodiplosis mosellana TaxID=263140 RepID=UPI002444CE96|nr:uncharacterized protein LOC129572357 [Sitodiplosis mosellana]
MNNKIKIKTEHDIEKRLGIKVENHQTTNNSADNLAEASSHSSWVQEKKSLIDSITALKSENQIFTRNLHEKDTQLSSVNASNKALETRLTEQQLEFSKKIDDLKSQLLKAVNKDEANQKCITDLKREHSLLISQNKQFQTGLAQVENETDSDDSEIYEVESLLDDKSITERHYLVHWKGYDSSHDSWERESNLSCAALLKKYKQVTKKR